MATIYKFGSFEFWAESGLITLVDNEAEDTQRLPPAEFMKRAVAAAVAEPDLYPDRKAKLRTLVENARDACKLALKQGDPTDSAVRKHHAQNPKRRSFLIHRQASSYELKPRAAGAEGILKSGVDVVEKPVGNIIC